MPNSHVRFNAIQFIRPRFLHALSFHFFLHPLAVCSIIGRHDCNGSRSRNRNRNRNHNRDGSVVVVVVAMIVGSQW